MSLPIVSKDLKKKLSKLQEKRDALDKKINELQEKRDALNNKFYELRDKRDEVEQKMRPLRGAIRDKKKKNPRPYYTYEPVMGENKVRGELMEMGDIVTYYGRKEEGEEAEIAIIRGMKVEIIIKGEKVIVTIAGFLKLKSRVVNGKIVKSKDGATLPRKRKRDSEQAGNVGSSSTMYFKY